VPLPLPGVIESALARAYAEAQALLRFLEEKVPGLS